ncbi:MAG: hydantoinase/oxoprolinase family protein, partial [Gammaproteobacteria bacterium]|nr:hydantoinase/oxoprolinase family protein [Gammaproteobacteria bacterium]
LVPMIDIDAIGAGGGSIAYIDPGGAFRVGPRSAGADPGPACYRRGGTVATVTDANLFLGRLSPAGLLDGQMPMDLDCAAAALAPLAERLGFSAQRTACGIVDIAVANMVRAIRRVSVERGHDPRDCTLLAFGGAGPLHARAVAASLALREVMITRSPGILCAQGLLVSDLTDEFVFSKLLALDEPGLRALREGLESLSAQAHSWFEQEAVSPAARLLELSLDARYSGQNFELPVVLWQGPAAELPAAVSSAALLTASALRAGFERAHEQAYGYANSEDPVEAVNLRLRTRAVQSAAEPGLPPASTGEARAVAHRAVWFDSESSVQTPIYVRDALAPGHCLQGPCVVEQLDTTTVVFPGDTLRVDELGNLILNIAIE